MADIRSYMKEKEKREKKERRQIDYKEKIARHKLSSVYRILLLLLLAAAFAVFAVIRYKGHIYTEYDIVATSPREVISGTTDIKLGSSILTYSKDGAHCTDARGNVTWNQTFEIQDVILATNGETVAIGEYNGRNIYIADSQKLLGQISTAMPIRQLAVSATGNVTAVLADTDITWINTYDSSGEMTREGRSRMDNSGYPMAISVSPDGELLMVAYVYVDAGILRTNIAFYNFGLVGANYSDGLVSNYSYTDMVIPCIGFLDDSTAFAVGDNRLTIFTGAHKPEEAAGHLYDREIRSVFYGGKYIGLVFLSDNNENRYQIKVYDTESGKVKDFYFDLDYTDIFFGKDNFVIYNETECQILTVDGREKFHGNFSKAVRLMVPVGNTYKYMLMTDDSIDTIQLK
nr:DUF5711 family protein [uncultured Acetatifactor sp.]